MSLLEVVFAVATLALVTITATSAFDYVFGAQIRERRTLAAAELCHRLTLQYLHDKDTLPHPRESIRYGGDSYRFSFRDDPIRIELGQNAKLADESNVGTGGVDRFRQITFRVWLGEESGGTAEFDPLTPHHALTRIADPIPFRNPKSFEGMAGTEDGLRELMSSVAGGAGEAYTSENLGAERDAAREDER